MAGDSDREAALQAVAERALSEWDLASAGLELVAIRENAVFRVDAADGRTYALRIHRPGYHDLAELNSELQWTAALRRAGISVPAPVTTRDGRGYCSVPMPGASADTRHVGLVEWIDGIPLQSVIDGDDDGKQGPVCFEQLGRIAARIHNQAVRWSIPAGFKRHALDADGLMGEQPWWGRFWEAPQLEKAERDLVLRARRAIHDALCAYGRDRGTYSLIHADLLPDNVMVEGGRLHVIDFDDAGFGWHQYELAVALSAYQQRDDYADLLAALIEGYRSEREIDDQALQLLPMFLLIRGLAVIGWIHQRPESDLAPLIPVLIKPVCAQAEAFLSDRGTR